MNEGKIEKFKCQNCGAIMNVEQNKGNELVYPKKCWLNQGGCSCSKSFKWIVKENAVMKGI